MREMAAKQEKKKEKSYRETDGLQRRRNCPKREKELQLYIQPNVRITKHISTVLLWLLLGRTCFEVSK